MRGDTEFWTTGSVQYSETKICQDCVAFCINKDICLYLISNMYWRIMIRDLPHASRHEQHPHRVEIQLQEQSGVTEIRWRRGPED